MRIPVHTDVVERLVCLGTNLQIFSESAIVFHCLQSQQLQMACCDHAMAGLGNDHAHALIVALINYYETLSLASSIAKGSFHSAHFPESDLDASAGTCCDYTHPRRAHEASKTTAMAPVQSMVPAAQ